MSSITIRSNISSLNALRRFDENTRSLRESFTRLSSGLRINRAGDDAAGLAIAESLRVDSRVFAQGVRNINDGISLLNIAEGSLQELRNITIRQLELAEQSANGVFTLSQRQALHDEAQSLSEEYNRIVATAEFNEQALLDQTLDEAKIQGGYGANGGINISLGAGLGISAANGTYQATATISTTDNDELVMIDVNNDGHVDAVGIEDDLDVFLGRGDGTFSAGVSYTASITEADHHISGDFNGDGNVDFVLRDYTSAATALLLGRGDGSFYEAQTFNTIANSTEMAAGDLNNDGRDDLIVSGDGSNSAQVYLSDQSGSLSLRQSISLGGQAGTPSIGDFNGDGKADFHISDQDNDQAVVFFGHGDGTFTEGATLNAPGGIARRGSSADFNRDGYSDIAFTAGNNVVIYHGAADNTFTLGATISNGFFANESRAGDINQDGFSDIISNRPATGETVISFGNGDGSFSAASTLTLAAGALDIADAFQDIDGDGARDIVAVGPTEFVLYSANFTTTSEAEFVYLLDKEGSKNALDSLEEQLTRITTELGNLGSVQSRLGTAVSNLAVARENFDSAASQIRDADIAFESARLVRRRILQQGAAGVLAQANQGPALALELL